MMVREATEAGGQWSPFVTAPVPPGMWEARSSGKSQARSRDAGVWRREKM